jgi:hypothetical protein
MTIRATALALTVGTLAAIGAFSGKAQATEICPIGASVILVTDGCGMGAYRGPGGACHIDGPAAYAPPVVYQKPARTQ